LPPISSRETSEDADRLWRHAADALELLAARIGVEKREERAEVGEVEERQSLLIRVVEDEGEALLLGLVRAEHLGEQERPEVGDRRAHRHARADPAEREVLDREPGRRPLDPELASPLLRRAVVRAGYADPRHVALHVRGEDRDAGGGELLRDDLERPGLAGAGGAGDQPVPVHRSQRDAHRRLRHEGAVVDARPELDRVAFRRVRARDRLAERDLLLRPGSHGGDRNVLRETPPCESSTPA
jgi:hypothetical protein